IVPVTVPAKALTERSNEQQAPKASRLLEILGKRGIFSPPDRSQTFSKESDSARRGSRMGTRARRLDTQPKVARKNPPTARNVVASRAPKRAPCSRGTGITHQ